MQLALFPGSTAQFILLRAKKIWAVEPGNEDTMQLLVWELTAGYCVK